MVGFWPYQRTYKTKLERIAEDKNSSFLSKLVNYRRKKFFINKYAREYWQNGRLSTDDHLVLTCLISVKKIIFYSLVKQPTLTTR